MRLPITSREAPELADYVSLRDSQLRRCLEGERGIFIAEGEKIIRRAFESGARPRSFLLAPKWLPGLADILEAFPEVPCLVADEALIETVSGFHVHRGALAAFERPAETPWQQILDSRRVLICEGLVDHANTGSIIRVAAALGWDAVLISPEGGRPPLPSSHQGVDGDLLPDRMASHVRSRDRTAATALRWLRPSRDHSRARRR